MIEQMSEYIRIAKAAQLAGVSITAIRSWVLEGYVEQTKLADTLVVNEEHIKKIVKERKEHPADWRKFCQKIK